MKIWDVFKNPLQKQIKILEDRSLSQKSSIFVIGLRQLFPRHTRKEEALCLSLSRERRKFKTYSERRHSGSHAIAWAAITIS